MNVSLRKDLILAGVLSLGWIVFSREQATCHAESPSSPDTSLPVRVINPRKLGVWELAAERVSVGEDIRVSAYSPYKPTVVLLPDGELVMMAFHQEELPDKKVREWPSLWRSSDGARSWTHEGEKKDIIGREEFLTCTSRGTLFCSTHLLEADVRNTTGYYHCYIHRSDDKGRTWQATRIGPDGFPDRAHTMCSRNVVETADGTLLLGVSLNDDQGSLQGWLWTSKDDGKTWKKDVPAVKIGPYRGKPYHNVDAFFCEDFTYVAKSGKLLHWVRCGDPSPMYPILDGRARPGDGVHANDNHDRPLLYESTDGGRTWTNSREFGDYGWIYPRVLRLSDGRLLCTYTQRSLFFPLGLRAILSDDDGETWDFVNDQIIIEGKTPWGKPSGGGFGNTVELKDGTLVSCSTYRGADNQTHLDTVRWRLPPK